MVSCCCLVGNKKIDCISSGVGVGYSFDSGHACQDRSDSYLEIGEGGGPYSVLVWLSVAIYESGAGGEGDGRSGERALCEDVVTESGRGFGWKAL